MRLFALVVLFAGCQPATQTSRRPSEPHPSDALPPAQEPRQVTGEPAVINPVPPGPAPSVGDGTCSGDETYASAPDDCPPPSVDFLGGDLDALRATSPTLTFAQLDIRGDLTLPAGADVTITVGDLWLHEGASIDVTWDTCEYQRSASLTIYATGSVVFAGPVDLSGRHGERNTMDAECRVCHGQDGGDLVVSAEWVSFWHDIDTHGGGGVDTAFVSGSDITYFGCDAGNGGDVILTATTLVDSAAARIDRSAGHAGYGTGGYGDAGIRGELVIDAPEIELGEDEANARAYVAQPLPLAVLSVYAKVSPSDDASGRSGADATFIYFDDGARDFIEDAYVVCNDDLATLALAVRLHGENPAADLDLYARRADSYDLLGESYSPTSDETLGLIISPARCVMILVSLVDGSTATSEYTLTFE